MKIMDCVIIAVVLLWLVAVLFFFHRKKKSGRCIGCGGRDCSICKKTTTLREKE